MASVPNMRLGPAEQPVPKNQPAESGEGGEFAQLMSGLPTPRRGGTVAESGGEAAATAPAPATSEEDEAGESLTNVDAILSLVALQTPAAATPAAAAAAGAAPGAAKGATAGTATPATVAATPAAILSDPALAPAGAAPAGPARDRRPIRRRRRR
jgi:hypothetical protein